MEPIYRIDQDQVCAQQVDDGVVLIHLSTTHYYSLNATGSFLWDCLSKNPTHLLDLVQQLADHYGVEPDQVRPDVEGLLNDLVTEDLVKPQWGVQGEAR
jgi:hypothetical protein